MTAVSGRCHGPGCQQTARVEYWCSEACQARWNAALTMPTPTPGYHPGGWVHPPALAPLAEVDLAPFQEAMNRAVRVLAEVTQLPADLLGNDSDTPERPDRTTAVAWGQPSGARPPFSSARFAAGGYIAGPPRHPSDDRVPALLSEGGCLQFWRGDHSGNHPLDEHPDDGTPDGEGATYPLVAPVDLQVAHSGMRGWLGRWIHRMRRTR